MKNPVMNPVRSFSSQAAQGFVGIIIAHMMDENDETRLGDLLRRSGLKLATAESCTGGLIGDRITNIPGSSDYYFGGVISYAYEAKVELLGVSWDTLHRYGAVSRETVLEMAQGVRRALRTDIGLAVSGIAGPGGGLPNKPVGTTWIGLCDTEMEDAWIFHFPGDRLQVKQQASTRAIRLLIDHLERSTMQAALQKQLPQPVEVNAQFDHDKGALPKSFVWEGKAVPIASIGRRWQAEDGEHLLVQDYQDRVFELLFSKASQSWLLLTSVLPPEKYPTA